MQPHWLWGPHSPQFSGYQGLFLQEKSCTGHEADHSHSCGAKVKNELSHISTIWLQRVHMDKFLF